jgi:hypothetical protein
MPAMRAAATLPALILAACGGSDAADPADAPAAAADAAPVWARYVIEPGAHDAIVEGGTAGNPLAGFLEVTGRDYQLAFDASAAYVITAPVEPTDQLDWNKLPGLSDCGVVDLSLDGAMFGWRWRTDLEPMRLEITAYANAAGTHQWLDEPLVTLTAADLAAETPLRYRLWPAGDAFHFTITGTVADLPIDAAATLPRSCPAVPATIAKWAAGLYFGGTSTAPSRITATVTERAFTE